MIKLITDFGTVAFVPEDKKAEYLERGYTEPEKPKKKIPKNKEEKVPKNNKEEK
ncbi:hypothetical protein J2Z60_000170 [Lactobacillus colini]|uniref:Phage protein n=1 Tax=Lactobacillus colini TaxID=1819254 RepID=A0ABS4MBG0_9LACO|nr:hypothetical protein [Lactobacillus colini]MBP2057008.1 hypothetical protein [Lactobacillus colini]